MFTKAQLKSEIESDPASLDYATLVAANDDVGIAALLNDPALGTSGDPGEAGSQTTSETTYTSYVRQAIARSGAGFVVTGNSVSPAANVVFPISTGGTPTITHFGIGTDSSGAGTLLYSGTVLPNIVVSTSVQQTLTTGSAITED